MKFATIPDRQVGRDRDLVEFLRAALADQQTGTEAEQRLRAVVVRVLEEFDAKFTQPDGHDYFAGQVDALGWVLRCVAEVFENEAGFSRRFLP